MKRPATLSATFVRTIRQPGRYGDGRGGHGLSLLVKPTKIKGATLQDLGTANPDQRQIHQPGVRELPSSHPGRRPPPGPTKQTVHRRRPPPPNPESANVSPGDREGDPTSRSQMETRRKIPRKLARNPRRLRSSPPWQQTGRSNHHSQHHGLPHPHVAPKPETARRVKQRISAVMKWCIAQGFREDNPADDRITAALGSNTQRPQHMKALHHSQVGAAIRTVEATDAHWATIAAFKFLTLTATRSGEVRNATWNEIDLSTAVWTIPSEHTKTGREHRVPLTTGALAVLATALPRSGGKGLVFHHPRDVSSATPR